MSHDIQWNDDPYATRVPRAQSPIATWISPRARSGEANVSARRLIQSDPRARPRMNALSINSNECVALPRTSDSIRIQSISYRNDAIAVPALTASRSPCVRSRRVGSSVEVAGTGLHGALGADRSATAATTATTAATARLASAATRMAPGRPPCGTSTKPASRTPPAAPRLFAK